MIFSEKVISTYVLNRCACMYTTTRRSLYPKMVSSSRKI